MYKYEILSLNFNQQTRSDRVKKETLNTKICVALINRKQLVFASHLNLIRNPSFNVSFLQNKWTSAEMTCKNSK